MQQVGGIAGSRNGAGSAVSVIMAHRIVLPRPLRKTARRLRRLLGGGVTVTRRGLFVFAAGFAGVTALSALVHSTGSESFTSRIAPSLGIAVSYYDVLGNREVSEIEVVKLIREQHGEATLFYDVDAARGSLLAHPWIADATVSKVYPNRLKIAITERQPFAVWQNEDGLWLVGRDGGILDQFDGRRSDLPLVVGKGAAPEAAKMISQVRQLGLFGDQIKGFVRVGERRWDIELRDGLVVMLPEENAGAALRHLAKLETDTGLLERDIDRIDMRLADRVVVALGPNAVETVSAQREEQVKEIRSAGKERAI